MKGGCFSELGMRRTPGPQLLNLDMHCYSESTIIHEFMHALGVLHYQQRNDRDIYVKINWNNIKPNKSHNFEKASPAFHYNTYDVEYDLERFMHYDAFAFAIDTSIPTMEPNVSIQNIV